MDVPAAAAIDGWCWAELRTNATTFRSYDTRSDDRLTWIKAAGLKQAVAAICVKVGYILQNTARTQRRSDSPYAAIRMGTMDLTREQRAFLADLRKGTCRATAAQDAGVIGPLIRANLVRWDDDPSDAGTRRKPPGSTFTLTPLGEVCLAEHDARGHVP